MTRRGVAVRRLAGPLLGLVASLAGLSLLGSRLASGFEQKTVDARMRLRGPKQAAPEVVVCAIDAASIDRLGQWPWSRVVLADLVRRLEEGGARAVALDVVFSEPSRCGFHEDDALAAAIREAGNVVLGYYFSSEHGAAAPPERPLPVDAAVLPPGGFPELPSYAGLEANLPALEAAARGSGHFVVQPDADGTVRHYSLILSHDGRIWPSLALRAVQVFAGSPPIHVAPRPGGVPEIRLGDLRVPISERGELSIGYRAPFGRTFRYLSASEVLAGRAPPGSLSDKLVFVGATEPGIGDVRTSPLDLAVPGVEIHATVADNLIHRRFLRDGAPEAALGLLAVLTLGPLCGVIAALAPRPLAGAAAAAGILLLYAALTHVALAVADRHLFLFVPAATGLAATTAASVWRNVFSEAKAREIRRTFARFVSEAVVEEMLRDPERVRLGGEKRELTVLFADIRGFTALSERLPPERVVELLNGFLTPVTRILLERGGTLDKYMGDAVMAFFGAPVAQPDHARRACEAALAIRSETARLAEASRRAGEPALACGIGLNTGPMAVGNMGSTMIFDYTVVGDHVNLGSRLEALTRHYGVDVLVSEFTRRAAGDGFVFRELDRVRVRGRSEPVGVFELFGTGPMRPEDETFLDAFASGLSSWRAGDAEGAARLLRRAAALRPGDGPSERFLREIAEGRTPDAAMTDSPKPSP